MGTARATLQVSTDSPSRTQRLGIARPCGWHIDRLGAVSLVRACSRVSPAPPDQDGALQRRTRLPRDLPCARPQLVRSSDPALCRGRASRLPEVRGLRAWLRARPLRHVRPRLARRILVQGSLRLPELRRTSHGQHRGQPGGSGPASGAGAPVGPLAAVGASRARGVQGGRALGARAHIRRGHLRAPPDVGQGEGARRGSERRGDTRATIRLQRQPERALPCDGARRRLHAGRRRVPAVPSRAIAHARGVGRGRAPGTPASGRVADSQGPRGRFGGGSFSRRARSDLSRCVRRHRDGAGNGARHSR